MKLTELLPAIEEKFDLKILESLEISNITSDSRKVSPSGLFFAIQGEKFDPDGTYIKKFIPELNKLPNKFIHEPWKADSAILKNSDIKLGDTYPNPIVDHKFARERALNKYAELRK